MSGYTYLRIVLGILAIVFAVLALVSLVTGRSNNGWLRVRRAANPKAYWTGLGLQCGIVLALAVTIACAPDGKLGIAMGLCTFGQLFALGLIGRFAGIRDNDWSPGARPQTSLAWLVMTGLVFAMSIAFLMLA